MTISLGELKLSAWKLYKHCACSHMWPIRILQFYNLTTPHLILLHIKLKFWKIKPWAYPNVWVSWMPCKTCSLSYLAHKNLMVKILTFYNFTTPLSWNWNSEKSYHGHTPMFGWAESSVKTVPSHIWPIRILWLKSDFLQFYYSPILKLKFWKI